MIHTTGYHAFYYGRIKKNRNNILSNPLYNSFMHVGYCKRLLGFFAYIPHASSIVAKTIYDRYNGFDTQYRIVADLDFFFKAKELADSVFVDDYLSVFRIWA